MYGIGMGSGWILLLLIGVGIYLFIRQDKDAMSGKSAQDILDERYARGDIDEKEYKVRREELRHH